MNGAGLWANPPKMKTGKCVFGFILKKQSLDLGLTMKISIAMVKIRTNHRGMMCCLFIYIC